MPHPDDSTPLLTPIETRYKGYRFRSRTEARWAVFFDAVGYEWTYEEQGYVLGDGSTYLPDFVVRDGDCNVWVAEVKGQSARLSLAEIKKILLFDWAIDRPVYILDGPPDFRMYSSARDFIDFLAGGFDWGWHQLTERAQLSYERSFHKTEADALRSVREKRDTSHPTGKRLLEGLKMLGLGDASWLTESDAANINHMLVESPYARSGYAMHSYKQRPWWDEHSNFWCNDSMLFTVETVDAIGYAKSARFEHGERPFCAPPW